MNSRIRSSSQTRREIVRAGGDLFHKRGVELTTIDEIAEAAGVSKAEFRQHFGGKLDVVSAVLCFYFEMTAADLGPVKYRLDNWFDLQECLASHLEFQKKFKMKRGCPIGTLGSGLKEGDELTRQSVSHIFDLMLARLESFFSREKVAGRLARNADVEQLANFCVAIIQGAMLTGKIRGNFHGVESTFEDLLGHLKRYSQVPTPRRKRLGRNGDAKRLFTLARPPEATTVMKLHDSPNLEDCEEEDHVELP
jgi:TetR/AcrR family transcriptional regulator, transcriptional repressor for nem operon